MLAEFRKLRIGQALLSNLAAIALQENRFGVMLHVLDCNEQAIGFYKDPSNIPAGLENGMADTGCFTTPGQ